ncbi:MAG: DUF1800 domain-containing protein [Pyrinomonadaceae bacterium]
MKNFRAKANQISSIGISIFLVMLFVIGPLAAMTNNTPNAEDGDTSKVLSENQRVNQVLSRLTFGARPNDFERVKALGLKNYIEQQLNPDSIDDSALNARLEKLPTLWLPTPTLAEQYNPPKPPPAPTPSPSPVPNNSAIPPKPPTAAATEPLLKMPAANGEMTKPLMTSQTAPSSSPSPTPTPAAKPTPPPKNPQMVVNELQRATVLRATYSERQLNEVLVDFWENHFSIYAQKDADRWLLTEFDRDAIRPFALGRFRDLLGATAHSPAMLYYLDNWQSSVVRKYPATKDKPARSAGGINENYARELMELHTLGVNGGYTQKDVQEVARCLTGWTIRKPGQEGTFIFNPQMHDNGEKIVLGQKIAAGGGISDVEKVLDILATHPSTARFIATKLARRFLGDNPPPAVVNQAAQVFLKTDGSIRETVRSIITSPAFLSAATYQTKVKSPFEFVVSSLRILGAETDANNPLLNWIAKMGQPLFGHITPEGYPDQSDEWLSSGSLLIRFNFANALAANKIKGTQIDAAKILGDVQLNDSMAVVAKLTNLILENEITPRTKEAIFKIAEQPSVAAPPKNPAPRPINANLTAQVKPIAAGSPPKTPDSVAELLTLVLGSPEFQRK